MLSPPRPTSFRAKVSAAWLWSWLVLLLALAPAHARPAALVLPPPSGDPRTVVAATDPVVAFAEAPGVQWQFTAAVISAARHSPAAREGWADAEQATGASDEARAALRPRIDLDLTGQQALARGFSHDPGNLIERSRPGRRADLSISAEQTLYDFGASANRLHAAEQRDAAASARAEAGENEAGLKAAAAWIDLRRAIAEADLAAAALARTRTIGEATRARIASGLGAAADAARVDAALGVMSARVARAEGDESAARARYAETFGHAANAVPPRPAPPGTLPPAVPLPTLTAALAAARIGPEVRYAAASVDAAARDLAAVRADRSPRVVFGIDAAKYSVVDPVEDHDIRARLSIRHRLYGGGSRARVDQAAARVEAAGFAAERIGGESARDAAIAWRDVGTENDAATALRESYLAERRARDAYAEAFRVSHGTLLELLRAESDLVDASVAYVRAVAASDLARWTLVARTGLLLAALGVEAGE